MYIMNVLFLAYIVLLFFVLSPGILLSLPPNSSKTVVAFTHALVFGAIYWITHKFVWKLSVGVPVSQPPSK